MIFMKLSLNMIIFTCETKTKSNTVSVARASSLVESGGGVVAAERATKSQKSQVVVQTISLGGLKPTRQN